MTINGRLLNKRNVHCSSECARCCLSNSFPRKLKMDFWILLWAPVCSHAGSSSSLGWSWKFPPGLGVSLYDCMFAKLVVFGGSSGQVDKLNAEVNFTRIDKVYVCVSFFCFLAEAWMVCLKWKENSTYRWLPTQHHHRSIPAVSSVCLLYLTSLLRYMSFADVGPPPYCWWHFHLQPLSWA